MNKDNSKTFIIRSFINSFRYLYQDAEYLCQLAHSKKIKDSFERVQLSRTALLLYIFSLEGLINRAMDHFLPEKLHDFFLDREFKLSLEKKWLLLPLLTSQEESLQFDRSKYPWSHLKELVRLRNDFVHPKHNRAVYNRIIALGQIEPLFREDIPENLGVKEKDLVYPNTQIPKDPHSVLPEHVDKAKKVVDDMVNELDRLLGGRMLQNDWISQDYLTLIYPPNAKFSDLPYEPQCKQEETNNEEGDN
jgi:hypothetical protein